jgi:IS605 OrfB family transposase
MTPSPGTSLQDGVKSVSFRISHRPHVQYERIRQLSIVYDRISGQLEARLMVEVRSGKAHGSGWVAIDPGERVLMTCAFDDGTLYSGRQIKAIRRYWQKVHANQKSRRWFQISHKERKQVDQLLHIATSHLIPECFKKGVREIATGDLNGIREGIHYSDSVSQRLHHWPYRKIIHMIQYKGEWAGIEVKDRIDERNTSGTCHRCGQILASNRKHRGFYPCSCGWKVQTDVNGALNIFERAFQVSPVRRVVAGWHGPWPCPTSQVGMVSLNRSTVLNCTHPDRMPPNLFGGECH